MTSAFRAISGVVEVDSEWREPSPKVLRHPAAHEPEMSRVVFHETVHYWQQLGQSFMAKIVQEDWQRLLRFETEKARDDVGPYRRHFVHHHDAYGFSAHELQESLARFWDVHVIGPHTLLEMEFADPRRNIDEFFKEQYFAYKQKGLIVHPAHGGYSNVAFDWAMETAAGDYGKPYQFIRKRFNPVVTGVVFPLAGHFALQTDRPVDVFVRTFEAVAPHLEKLPPGQAIHDLWKACYRPVHLQAQEACRQLGIGPPTPAGAVLQNGSLGGHPVYGWVLSQLHVGRNALANSTLAADVTRAMGRVSERFLGLIMLDLCLACPGDTTNRSFLVEWLAPPCVRFPDGRLWLLTELHRRELVTDIDDLERSLSEERRTVAREAVNIHARWLAFRRAVRGY